LDLRNDIPKKRKKINMVENKTIFVQDMITFKIKFIYFTLLNIQKMLLLQIIEIPII